MVSKHSSGKENQREMEDVYRLHKSQQGVPEICIPLTKHQPFGG